MDWRKLVGDSFVRPRAAAREVVALGLGRGLLVQAAAAITAAGVVLGYVAVSMSAEPVDPVSAAVLSTPLIGAAMQFGILLVAAVLTFRIGRAFGGTGDFDGALAIVVWLNAVMLLIQVAQLFVLAVLPPLAGLIAVATVVWALWAFANFVTELHSFENPFFVLGGVILSMIVLFFGVAMLLAMLGITPQESL
jgi:Yip1 domain